MSLRFIIIAQLLLVLSSVIVALFPSVILMLKQLFSPRSSLCISLNQPYTAALMLYRRRASLFSSQLGK